MSKIAQERNKVVYFCVHRKELFEQTVTSFKKFDIDLKTIHIVMIKTLAIKIKNNKLKLPKADFILYDEAHFALANTWNIVTNYFSDAYFLGVTGSPIRLDGKGLGELFEKMVVGISAKQLIKQGDLCNYDYYSHILIDFSDLKVKNGDYDLVQASEILDKPKIYGDVINHYNNLAKGKKAICYCPSVVYSKMMSENFNQAGIKAEHFDATTKKQERARIVEDFRNGKIKILCNVDLISVGFDLPDCKCCILLRPTTSLALFIQQSMRCLRPNANKRAIIIDHVGNVFKHDLPDAEREWSLEAKKIIQKTEQEKEVKARQCEQCFLVYSGVSAICPFCGFDNGKTKKQIKTDEKIELERIEKIDKKNRESEVWNCENERELKKIGIERGYEKTWYRLIWARHPNNKKRKKYWR